MANVSKAQMSDKELRNLEILPRQYKKAVGNPKELYVWVNPSGKKTFSLRFGGKFHQVGEFRAGIFSVAEARKKATEMLHLLENGASLDSDKYTLGRMFDEWCEWRAQTLSPAYIAKISGMMQLYILPRFGGIDIAEIRHSDLLGVLKPLFNPANPKNSRLETIHRIIYLLSGLFKTAIRDGHIVRNPCDGLHDEFPTPSRYAQQNGAETRYPALTDEAEIAEFLRDLKCENRMDLVTRRAIYLQILCFNRPANTAAARWEDIDLDSGIWTIPAAQMKMRQPHQIALSSHALAVLREQRNFSFNEFVFSTPSTRRHLNRDTMSKALRTLAGGRWEGRVTAHGWRATFRTICTLHLARLGSLGVSEKTIENALAHKEQNAVKFSYERQTATIEQNRILMQWYGDFLNSLMPFGF